MKIYLRMLAFDAVFIHRDLGKRNNLSSYNSNYTDFVPATFDSVVKIKKKRERNKGGEKETKKTELFSFDSECIRGCHVATTAAPIVFAFLQHLTTWSWPGCSARAKLATRSRLLPRFFIPRATNGTRWKGSRSVSLRCRAFRPPTCSFY